MSKGIPTGGLAYKTMIKVEDHDMIQKLAYLYWYEHVCKDGWSKDQHEGLYERTKSEVMKYGLNYSKDDGN
jgi:hypothetical protein